MRLIDADRFLSQIEDQYMEHDITREKYMDLEDRIMQQPTIEQPHWIPVTERMPEEKQDVILAFKHNMAVGFWEDILQNGEPVWYANSGDGWMTGTESVDNDGIPIAWMPLPEAWKGEEDER